MSSLAAGGLSADFFALLQLTSPQQHIINLLSIVASGNMFIHIAPRIPLCEHIPVAVKPIQLSKPIHLRRLVRSFCPLESKVTTEKYEEEVITLFRDVDTRDV